MFRCVISKCPQAEREATAEALKDSGLAQNVYIYEEAPIGKTVATVCEVRGDWMSPASLSALFIVTAMEALASKIDPHCVISFIRSANAE